jgi:nicotinamidase-related amidase
LTAARTAGVPVVFTLGGGGKPADLPKDLAPAANEPAILAGVDKFFGTDLEKILKEKGAKTVIVVGTAANGAVLYTASAGAMRGMKVIVAVDGVSADTPYIEQYVAWHLVNVPVIGPAFTLTTIDQITF